MPSAERGCAAATESAVVTEGVHTRGRGYSHSKLAWVFRGAPKPSTLFKGEIWENYLPYIGEM